MSRLKPRPTKHAGHAWYMLTTWGLAGIFVGQGFSPDIKG